jgi:hypothetical protein
LVSVLVGGFIGGFDGGGGDGDGDLSIFGLLFSVFALGGLFCLVSSLFLEGAGEGRGPHLNSDVCFFS